MRIAIAGASGFVGKQLVSVLEKQVDELLIVGRNPEELTNIFPEQKCIGYDELATSGLGFDMLLCLLTMNNNVVGSLADFRNVNVVKVRDLAKVAEVAGIKKFVHFSTFQIVGVNSLSSHYSQTKLEAEKSLLEFQKIKILNLRLPLVYGSKFYGKLSVLARAPKWSQKLLLGWLSAIKPVVHVDLIAKELLTMKKNSITDHMFLSDSPGGNFWYKVAKRVIDISGSLTVLIVLGWLFPIVWLAIKLSSNGPGIFSQRRVGRDKKEFNCYKFRTMLMDTVQTGTHEIPASSVTKIGKFLRTTKIDELPQVINVLKNEMSLVGPRPCLPQQVDVVEARDSVGVFAVKPGITGLAQVKGIDMSRPGRIAQVDCDYTQVQCLWLDVKILLATIRGRGAGDRIVRVKET